MCTYCTNVGLSIAADAMATQYTAEEIVFPLQLHIISKTSSPSLVGRDAVWYCGRIQL